MTSKAQSDRFIPLPLTRVITDASRSLPEDRRSSFESFTKLLVALLRYEPAIPWATFYLGNYYIFQWARPDAYGLLDHTWSLCVEEHFYLLWPPVAALLSPRASRRVLVFGFLPLAILTRPTATSSSISSPTPVSRP